MTSWIDYRNWIGANAFDFVTPSVTAPSPESFSTDSRSIGAGEWFVPLSGDNFDGHKFIADAMGRGAAGFFYAKSRSSDLPADLRAMGLAVTDPLAAMQAIATGWRLTLKQLTLAALTGSTGKTTTKEMLGAIFRAAGPTYATPASFNNEIGVPKTLLQLKPEHRYAAVEFGARLPGNIRFLCGLARPDVVGIVNVGISHVGIFGSVENLLNTKLEIFRDSGANARQVALHDDPRILAGTRSTGKPTVTFGVDPAADVAIVRTDWSNGGMTVRLRIRGDEIAVPFEIAHEALPINAAAAAAMATASGVALEAIARGLTGFKGIKGRYQVHRQGASTLIDDTYNASPDSMRAGLTTLARSFSTDKLVLILGDMLELGDCSADEHRKIGAFAERTVHPEHLVCVGSDARFIAEGARSEGLAADRIVSFGSVDELLTGTKLGSTLRTHGNVLYAKASHGVRLDKLVAKLLGEP